MRLRSRQPGQEVISPVVRAAGKRSAPLTFDLSAASSRRTRKVSISSDPTRTRATFNRPIASEPSASAPIASAPIASVPIANAPAAAALARGSAETRHHASSAVSRRTTART
jgi:hypothetical protein